MRLGLAAAIALYLAALALAGDARAEDARAAAEDAGDDEGDDAEAAPRVERVPPVYDTDPFATKPGYTQLFVTTYVGDGLRFDNPYRLSTALGSDAESLSRTAAYVDVGLGMTFGDPLGLQHGFTLRTSGAVEGVGQLVMTPSYLAWRRWSALAVHGRAGVPMVLTPDLTWGLEVAGGGTWFFLGGLGLSAEIVGDVFYGAGTLETNTVTYPVLSAQLGLVASYEVLP
jgi:hypothetical protein